MNVVSQMIKDHEHKNSSELNVFADNNQDSKWIKRTRNIVVAFLVLFIVGLGVVQYTENSSRQSLAEQVVEYPAKIEKTQEVKPVDGHPVSQMLVTQVPESVSVNQVKTPPKLVATTTTHKPEAKPLEKKAIQPRVAEAKKSKPVATESKPHKIVKKPEVMLSQKRSPAEKVVNTNDAARKIQKPMQVVSAEPLSKPAIVPEENKPELDDAADMTKELRKPTKMQLAQQTYSAAITLIKKKQVKKAEEYLKRALELNAQHLRAREILAGLYIKQQRQAEVIKLLSEGLVENPNYFKFRQLLARLYADQNKIGAAVEVLDGATDLQKESADYLSFVAALNQQAGNFEQARIAYQAALEIKPAEGSWWLGLGLAFESSKNYSEAEKAYVRAKQIGNLKHEILQYIERRLAAVRLYTVSMN